MIVASKTAPAENLLDGIALQDVFFAQINPRFCNVSVKGDSGGLFEHPGDVLTRDIKFLFQPLQRQVLCQMAMDKAEHIVHGKILRFLFPAHLIALCAGPEKQNQKQGQQAQKKWQPAY